MIKEKKEQMINDYLNNWKSIGQIIDEIDFEEIFNIEKDMRKVSDEPLEPQSGSGNFDKQNRKTKGK